MKPLGEASPLVSAAAAERSRSRLKVVIGSVFLIPIISSRLQGFAQVAEWLKATDCKSVAPWSYGGSNPPLCTSLEIHDDVRASVSSFFSYLCGTRCRYLVFDEQRECPRTFPVPGRVGRYAD